MVIEQARSKDTACQLQDRSTKVCHMPCFAKLGPACHLLPLGLHLRLQANQILGLAPGEIFVQRNVGNQAMHTDMNLMSCLEYAVKSLKVGTRDSQLQA